MGHYSYDTIKTVILNLRDAIILTDNASLAVCWLVELFVAMCAYKHGIKNKLVFNTNDAAVYLENDQEYLMTFKCMVRYRNKYVHESYLSVNSNILNLEAVKEFALKYCSINLDLDNKEFDEF